MPVHLRRNGFDPVPEMSEIRDRDGVCRIHWPFGVEAWLVSRYTDVREVLDHPERFSNAGIADIIERHPPDGLTSEKLSRIRAGSLISFDPPEHTRLRRILAPEFTERRMRRLEPRIREIVDERLSAIERAGPPSDLMADFARPAVAQVLGGLLGLTDDACAEYLEHISKYLSLSLPEEERLRHGREAYACSVEMVAKVQAEPGEGMLGMLVREYGDDLSSDELRGIADLLLAAGYESTASMLGLGTLALLRHPEQLTIVRDEPGRVDTAVEELLRWLSVIHAVIGKVTTTEVEIAGQRIGAGELVMYTLPAANRDPLLCDDPDRLDVTRGSVRHLAFGHGIHHCLGAPLARKVMRIALPALLRRFPGLRAVSDEAEFRSLHHVFGLASLQVSW
jgi:cytochrome P450